MANDNRILCPRCGYLLIEANPYLLDGQTTQAASSAATNPRLRFAIAVSTSDTTDHIVCPGCGQHMECFLSDGSTKIGS